MRNSPKRRALTSAHSSPPATADIELALLRDLCRAQLTSADWSRIERQLREYLWQDNEHGLVYAATRHLGTCDPQLLREQLPAEATRMGFPDVDWRRYFGPDDRSTKAASVAKIARGISQLLAAASPASPSSRD
ncbi:MAG TPA: hypothetical protein VHX36_09125 [Candidatus Acidoferrales bacterium]|jgi:hypothetical protein|nr:hypothetical protein [Candidatus Acidoferrales bacterium]